MRVLLGNTTFLLNKIVRIGGIIRVAGIIQEIGGDSVICMPNLMSLQLTNPDMV